MLEAINQGKNQHLVRRQGVVGRNIRKDTTARFRCRGTCFSENAVFSPFEASFISVGEVIAKVCKSLAEAAKMPDKRKHFKVGMTIGLIVGVISAFYVGLAWGALIGFIAGCIAGAIKEWLDSKGHGTVELMDFAFTAMGAASGACVSVPVMMLLRLFIQL
ncbi:MAG: hypothetical protein KIG16_05085 [Eubacteriales bacterium]|nr:hypothetical protein [Eubacteriales bacterium]